MVTYKEDAELRDEISFAFAGAKCPIYEMKSASQSLEDIFLHLTGNEQAAVEEAIEKKVMPAKPEKIYESVEEAMGETKESLFSAGNDKEGE